VKERVKALEDNREVEEMGAELGRLKDYVGVKLKHEMGDLVSQ